MNSSSPTTSLPINLNVIGRSYTGFIGMGSDTGERNSSNRGISEHLPFRLSDCGTSHIDREMLSRRVRIFNRTSKPDNVISSSRVGDGHILH